MNPFDPYGIDPRFRPPGQHFERAVSPQTPSGLGDPERWGGNAIVPVVVGTAAATYEKDGPQIVRAQVPDLVARGWVLQASYSVSNLGAGDVPAYLLRVASGAGQNSFIADLDLLAIARAAPYWVQVTAGGQTLQGAVLLPVPLVGASINIAPRAAVTTAAPGLGYTATFEFNVSISPWSLG